MSDNQWNYMVQHLAGKLDILVNEESEQNTTDRHCVYVEQYLIDKESTITYHRTIARKVNS